MAASVWKQIAVRATALFAVLGMALSADAPAHAQLGRSVENTASLSFETAGVEQTLATNTAVFVVEARRTPSTVEFFRFAPQAGEQIQVLIPDSHFSPSGAAAGPFEPVGPPVTAGGVELDFAQPAPLALATTYLPEELIVVRVEDAGQNGQPDVIETGVVTIAAESGDLITLCLFESGEDTGEFFGYLPSTRSQTATNDPTLTVLGSDTLTATYVDAFDATEVSVDTAFVDPFGRVFNSVTGELLNGVAVTLIDEATGAPAEVFGVDGVSAFPSTVLTGSVVTDDSGLIYELGPGEFLFPQIPQGTYRLEIAEPDGFVFPSNLSPEAFVNLENEPFDIVDASYGQTFTLDALGPKNFDAPLDPAGDLVVMKDASVDTVSPGGFVGYTVTIENRGDTPLPVAIRDDLPAGFRFQPGSARVDGAPIADPDISPDGQTLLLSAGLVPSGGSVRLTYATEAGAGTPLGEAVNAAFAVNGTGGAVSNRAEAAVFVREDLLRSAFTIIGRVAADACDPDEDWAREIGDGVGVPGVRLYLETGDFVVSDEDGLFHFEAIEPGTHVVQIDEATLPAGYEPVACGENTRYAGSATSQFVEAIGGTIWRADFFLRRTDEAVETYGDTDDEAIFNDATEYLLYDQAWIDAQAGAPAWAYPDASRTPSARSVNLGIVHARGDRVRLTLNGEPVPGVNFDGRDESTDRLVELSRWRGVDIRAGENVFEAYVIGADGEEKAVLQRTIWFVDEIRRARLVDDQSVLAADGRTTPVVAVRLTDGAGRPVHGGRAVEVDLDPPYRLENEELFEGEAPISAALAARTAVSVDPDGIARIRLAPTLDTGRVKLRIRLDDGRQEEIDVFLRPEKRDWILVGLAEGSLGQDRFTTEAGVNPEGRVALFAKGLIKGDWLLTLAIDTAKARGDVDDELFNEIDPDAFYTLFGDRTFQDQDAASQFPVYVKLEKDTFQALFGDFNTGLTDSVLGRHSRNLTGLRTIYEGERFSFNGFAAETNQSFVREELAADGTSGPFVLESAPLVRNSETIFIEARDRFRADEVVGVTTLSRFLDYDIDFETGEILFRRPIETVDAAFNPNVIVVEYESISGGDRDITFGGRAAARFADGAVETGVTYVQESSGTPGGTLDAELAAIDATARIADNTIVRAEVGVSSQTSDGETDEATAILVEVVHQTEKFEAAAFFREDDGAFGLGQQSSAQPDVRRYGVSARLNLSTSHDVDAGSQKSRFVESEIFQEDNLATGASRTVAEVEARQDGQRLGLAAGLRTVTETFGEETRNSLLLTGEARKSIPSLGLSVSASREQPLNGLDESSLFPARTILGLDKTLTRFATLNVRHEFLNGANASGQNTVAGVTVTPWTGAQVNATTDLLTQDGARRLGATIGVDQTFRVSEHWSAGLGVSRRANIDVVGEPLDVAPDAALSPLETAPPSPLTGDDSFTSVYVGAGYRGEKSAGSGRIEVRDTALGARWTGLLGAAREATDQLSFAGALRVQQESLLDTDDRRTVDGRLALSYRPRGKGPVIFNRLDISHDEVFSQSTNWKIVNNFGINAPIGKRAQVAGFYGVKYDVSSFEGDQFSGVTQLVGTEVRFDVTRRIDLGFSGSALYAANSGTLDYSYGPSIGVSPAENTWISFGWNFAGFEDRDFDAAEFANEGPFVKLRIKFDQNTAAGLLNLISPRGR